MNWKLPEDLEIDEIIYLQEKVYPKLKESFLYKDRQHNDLIIQIQKLVQYLMESGEHLDQYRAQRRDEYESLLQEREELIKKGKLEQGSDYDQSSDDEKKKVDQKIKNFENLHKNEMEHIKTERSQQDSQRRSSSRLDQLNEYIKSQQKEYYEDKVLEQQRNVNDNRRQSQAEGEQSSRSQNKFKKIDRFSEASSDNGTDPDEYIRRDSYQRNQSFHVFNPLVFLAQQLKKRNQQTK